MIGVIHLHPNLDGSGSLVGFRANPGNLADGFRFGAIGLEMDFLAGMKILHVLEMHVEHEPKWIEAGYRKKHVSRIDHLASHSIEHDYRAIQRGGNRQEVGRRGRRVHGLRQFGRQIQKLHAPFQGCLIQPCQIFEPDRQAEIDQRLLGASDTDPSFLR